MMERRASKLKREDVLKTERLRRDISDVCLRLRDLSNVIKRQKPFNMTNMVLEDWSQQIVSVMNKCHDSIAAFESTATPPVSVPSPFGGGGLSSPKALQVSMSELVSRMKEKEGTKDGASTVPISPTPPQGGKQANSPRFFSEVGASSVVVPPNKDQMSRIPCLAQGLYVFLDAVMRAANAEKAVVHVPIRNDITSLRPICVTGGGPDCSLADYRIRDANSPQSLALRTGIMVVCDSGHDPLMPKGAGAPEKSHLSEMQQLMQEVDESVARSKYWSAIASPVRTSATAAPVAVITLYNKNNGRSNFDMDDEHVAFSASFTLATLLQRCDNTEMLAAAFDPQLPIPAVAWTGEKLHVSSKEQLVFHTWGSNGKEVTIMDPVTNSAVPLNEKTPLLHVGDYIFNLQQTWKKAVEMNLTYQETHDQRSRYINQLTERLRAAEFKMEAMSQQRMDELEIDPEARPTHLLPPEPADTCDAEAQTEDYIEDGVCISVTPTEGRLEALGRTRGLSVIQQVESLAVSIRPPAHFTSPSSTTEEGPPLLSPEMTFPNILIEDGAIPACEFLETKQQPVKGEATTAAATTSPTATAPLAAKAPPSAKAPPALQLPKAAEKRENEPSSPFTIIPKPFSDMDKAERVQRLKKKVVYKLGSVIGLGANSVVYHALIEETGEMVAAKQVTFSADDPKWETKVQALQNEIAILRKVEHPHIVRYLFTDSPPPPEKGNPSILIFMEYVAGGTLASMLSQFGKFTEKTAAIFVAQILLGLCHLHEEGVIHRDVKPANCLVSAFGVAKLADFGTAKDLQITTVEEQETGEVSKEMTFAGTPYYMAPEVIRQEPSGAPADIWSLGCTLMEMLTGSKPWAHIHQDVVAVLSEVAVNPKDLPIPKGLSPLGQSFLQSCLRKSESGRATAKELLDHNWFVEHEVFEKVPGRFGSDRVNTGLVDTNIGSQLLSQRSARVSQRSMITSSVSFSFKKDHSSGTYTTSSISLKSFPISPHSGSTSSAQTSARNSVSQPPTTAPTTTTTTPIP